MQYKNLISTIMISAFILTGCALPLPQTQETKSGLTNVLESPSEVTLDAKANMDSDSVISDPDDIYTRFKMLISYSRIDDSYDLIEGDDNEIQKMIAEKTGVILDERLLEEKAEDRDEQIADSDLVYLSYIDFNSLYRDSLVAWDSYLDKYPELRSLYSDYEWDQFREPDGKIYWAGIEDSFRNCGDVNPVHKGQAFWIQVRVLEWAGYPEIRTLDQYFDLLERYSDANPTMPGGEEIIPYEIFNDTHWYPVCFSEAPTMLAGYPDDGLCIVDDSDPDNPKVIDYNTSDTAHRYYQKLNEEYQKGIANMERDHMDYLDALESGRVLGMYDVYENIYFCTNDYYKETYYSDNLMYSDIGCEYVPLALSLDGDVPNRWHDYDQRADPIYGIAVTTSCKNPDQAFYFLNSLLNQEIHDLRFWGVSGVDFLVDSEGLFYRTDEMREMWSDSSYIESHVCEYAYCPQWKGLRDDWMNAMKPCDQPGEFLATMSEPVKRCLQAYGVMTYTEFMGSEICEAAPWHSLYSFVSRGVTEDMDAVKDTYLYHVITYEYFDMAWDEYVNAYEERANAEEVLDEIQSKVDEMIE